jgi:hypothetical protein
MDENWLDVTQVFKFYRTFYQCCGSNMFIPDPDPNIFHSGYCILVGGKSFSLLLKRINLKICTVDFTN